MNVPSPNWPDLPGLDRALDGVLGGVLYASIGGVPRLHRAFGTDAIGRQVSTGSRFAIYCAGKPVLAFTCWQLVAQGELSFNDRLADVVEVDLSPDTRNLTVEQLLTHSAGLARPQRAEAAMLGWFRPDEVAPRLTPLRGWKGNRGRTAFSEFAGWYLLSLAMEGASSLSTVDLLREHVPVCASPAIVYGPQLLHENDDVFINTAIRDGQRVPLLAEARHWMYESVNPGFNWYASASGLGNFYEYVLESSAATQVGSPVTPWIRASDVILGEPVSFGLGVFAELGRYDWGGVSESAFGHPGWEGRTLGLADPQTGLVVAYHLTSSPGGAQDHWRRHEILGAILSEVLTKELQDPVDAPPMNSGTPSTSSIGIAVSPWS